MPQSPAYSRTRPQATGTLLVSTDIGAAWGGERVQELARHLELRLKQPVVPCLAEHLAASVHSLVEAGCPGLVVVPLGLLPVGDRTIVAHSLALAKQKWPFLSVHLAAPLTWLEWNGWLRVTALEAAEQAGIEPSDAAVVLIGPGDAGPLMNADLARLAHLMQETTTFACVTHAFLDVVRPDIYEAIGARWPPGKYTT